MTLNQQIADWLESHWVTPAYSGWLLLGVTSCFFGAAVNTMAGWLYVLSGLGFALLGIAAILPVRSLRGIKIRRSSIQPVSAGEALTVEIEIANQTKQPKNLLQIQDLLPFVLGKPVQAPIEVIPPHASYRWVYHHPTQQRGVYLWYTVRLRTAAPVGLFWCRRHQQIPATAIVYPNVLPLTTCPIIDRIGQANQAQSYNQQQRVQLATEGLTRSLRPYRKGDPLRLIHWRSSARYGEFRVRELELTTEGQEIVICLDSAGSWEEDSFEQAVIAAASLYFYAHKQQLNVQLWTAATGLVQGRAVLHTLAATNPNEAQTLNLPKRRIIWLSQNVPSLDTIPPDSYWLLWANDSTFQSEIVNHNSFGLMLNKDQPLQPQLQKALTASKP